MPAWISDILGYTWKLAVGGLVVALLVNGTVQLAGGCILRCGSSETLPPADSPPLEYAYLAPGRVAAYLGQAQNGLASTERRTRQLTKSVEASLSAGGSAKLGESNQAQEGSAATVTPTAADHMYAFLRLLRKGGEARAGKCGTGKPGSWLGKVDDESSPDQIMKEVGCIGVGNFVRIVNAQLFVPPFAQALRKMQSVSAFYGELPAPRTPFTSPTQSAGLRVALIRYEKSVGRNPRLPLVASPYGSPASVGQGVTFFLPTEYSGFKFEPSLLSGALTIFGKVVYYAKRGAPYIDYPTITTFGKALREAPPVFLSDLGVCSSEPPPATRSHPPSQSQGVAARRKRSGKGQAKPHPACSTFQQTLRHVKKAVSLKAPFVVVLPLAIYQ